jgi:hypothetical protein
MESYCELEKMWTAVAMIYSKALTLYFLGDTEERNENIQ